MLTMRQAMDGWRNYTEHSLGDDEPHATADSTAKVPKTPGGGV